MSGRGLVGHGNASTTSGVPLVVSAVITADQCGPGALGSRFMPVRVDARRPCTSLRPGSNRKAIGKRVFQ